MMNRPRTNYRPTKEERFWRWVDIAGPDDCWPWAGSTNEYGYGYGPNDWAHRLAYKYAKGAIPEGEVIRHSCDNPPCCNPAHLLTGTQKQNLQDMVDRGRSSYGVRHWNAILLDEQIVAIQQDPRPSRLVAPDYGVSDRHIRKIRQRTRRVTAHVITLEELLGF